MAPATVSYQAALEQVERVSDHAGRHHVVDRYRTGSAGTRVALCPFALGDRYGSELLV
jgi:hypothetical protein